MQEAKRALTPIISPLANGKDLFNYDTVKMVQVARTTLAHAADAIQRRILSKLREHACGFAVGVKDYGNAARGERVRVVRDGKMQVPLIYANFVAELAPV